jgi:hypothetical protein
MHRGWIKAWRKEYDSAIWDKPPLYLKVWRWICYRCDRKTGKWIGALSQIADGCQWEENNRPMIPARETIRRILKWMETEEMVDLSACDRQKTAISVVNWHIYQGQDVGLVTPERQQKDSNKTSTRSIEKSEDIKAEPKDMSANADMAVIVDAYHAKIANGSRLTKGAAVKIRTRLKTYTQDDLLRAIDQFATEKWWMENNAHRGIAWFFHSDDRIDQFLNLNSKGDPPPSHPVADAEIKDLARRAAELGFPNLHALCGRLHKIHGYDACAFALGTLAGCNPATIKSPEGLIRSAVEKQAEAEKGKMEGRPLEAVRQGATRRLGKKFWISKEGHEWDETKKYWLPEGWHNQQEEDE